VKINKHHVIVKDKLVSILEFLKEEDPPFVALSIPNWHRMKIARACEMLEEAIKED